MNVPTNLFMWIMACLPIIVLLLLLIKFQWGATEAAPIGLLITIITAVAFYKADFTLLASETAKGIWSALPILLIVWTAILLYQVADEAKAFLVIRNGMRKLLPNELLLVLALGWILESFLQGITGFGVPVAVGAPLLIGIGMNPMWAVILPLLGQSWGNTFGTLAAAWDSLASTSGLTTGSPEYFAAALWASAFLFVWDVITGLIMCWFYGKGAGVKKGLPAVLILAVIQGGGELLLSQVNTTLSCFIPSCVSLVALFLIGRMKMYREEWKLEDSPIMNRAGTTAKEEEGPSDMSLLQAFVPYFILTALTIIVLVVKPINEFLGQFSIGFSFAETSTGYGFVNQAVESFSPLVPFTHASMFLFLSSIVGLIYYGSHGWIKKGGTGRVFAKSVAMTMPSGIAVIGLVIMSRIMGGTGQTDVLADGISRVLGKAYAILSPVVGLIGTFMTASNMSSNILFGAFQSTTAGLLGLNEAAVLGAQTAGGAIGAAISPSKIILGTTTAGILGREGEVLKKLMPIAIGTTIVIGLVVFATAVL